MNNKRSALDAINRFGQGGTTRWGLAACAVMWAGAAAAQAVVEPGALQKNSPPPHSVRAVSPGQVQVTIGMANAAEPPAPGSKGPNCVGEMREASHVTVPVGKSTIINLPEPVRNRTVGNPHILQAMLVSSRSLYLLGLSVGSTNMIVQGRSGTCSVIDVAVGADPGGVQAALAELMPDEKNVRVYSAADSLVLSGTVSDSLKAQRVVEIANAFAQRASSSVDSGNGAGTQPGGGPAQYGGGASGGQGEGKSARIVNMMGIAAPQQVMLEVKVAEVSKTLIDQLGASADINGAFGSWSFGLLANFLSGSSGVVSAVKNNHLPLNFNLDAEKRDGLVKILAEPNLMAISGQTASFLAGGKVFIPVPQSNGTGGSTIVLQEEQFGVGLKFTPTVLDGGRINLQVAPEVSELSTTGVTLTAPNVSGSTILPLINTRRASTTVQLRDGQSFAIGGLIKNNITSNVKALPGLGEVPVLGALFRSTNFQQDKTELVFVITPRLVKPLDPNYPLPTDTFGQTNTAGVLLLGDMEGRKKAPAPAGTAVSPLSQQPAQPAVQPATPPAAPPTVPTVPPEASRDVPAIPQRVESTAVIVKPLESGTN
ncbi:type II and III secretion system protein family protein [Pandoraea terrae]